MFTLKIHACRQTQWSDPPNNVASTIVQNNATELYTVRLVLVSPGTNDIPVSGSVSIVRLSPLASSRAGRSAVPDNIWGSAAPEVTWLQKIMVVIGSMTGCILDRWLSGRGSLLVKKERC